MIAQSKSAKALLDRLESLSNSLEPVGAKSLAVEYPTLKVIEGTDIVHGKSTADG